MKRNTRSKQKTPSPPATTRGGSKRRASPTSPDDALPSKTRRAAATVVDKKSCNSDKGSPTIKCSPDKGTRSSGRQNNSPNTSPAVNMKTPPSPGQSPLSAKASRTTRRGGGGTPTSSAASPSSSITSLPCEEDMPSPVSVSSNGSNSGSPSSAKGQKVSRLTSQQQSSSPRRSSRGTPSITTPTTPTSDNSTKRRSQSNTPTSVDDNSLDNNSNNNSSSVKTELKSTSPTIKKKPKTTPTPPPRGRQKRVRPATSSEEESPVAADTKTNKPTRAAKKRLKKRKAEEQIEVSEDITDDIITEAKKRGNKVTQEKNGIESNGNTPSLDNEHLNKNSAEDEHNNVTVNNGTTKNSLITNNGTNKNGKENIVQTVATPERRSRRKNNTAAPTTGAADAGEDSVKSSRAESAKRRLSNSSASDCNSPEKKTTASTNKRIRVVPQVNGIKRNKNDTESQLLENNTSDNPKNIKKSTKSKSICDEKDEIKSVLETSVQSTDATETPTSNNGAATATTDSKVSSGATDEDMVTDVEQLLLDLGLKEKQAREVISRLPEEFKDACAVSAPLIRSLLWSLLRATAGGLEHVTSPRCNRLVRQLLDHYCSMEQSHEDKHKLCQECVSWARSEHRSALCQELEVSLMQLYASTGHWRRAEQTATALYASTKNMQDKEKIVKACLCLSRCYHAMQNLSKSRGFITTAKTEALKMYTPPLLQAELDLQSGILQIAEAKDLETAVSYLKEAASGSPDCSQRSLALKYLVLGCLLLDRPHDGHKAAQSPLHLADVDKGVEAMLAVCDTTASVHKFRCAREKYKSELEDDPVVGPQLDQLYIEMMEKNILKIIMPYKRVQIQHVADVIGLERVEVERRLSQMILDGTLSGQLDHRDHCLYLYPEEKRDPTYEAALGTIQHLEKTVQTLATKAGKLLI